MEYMALGKPIVQFDVCEGRRSALDASLYATKNDPLDFASKLVALIDDREKGAVMGAYGRDRVERELQWSVVSKNLVAAYESLRPATPVPQCATAPSTNP